MFTREGTLLWQRMLGESPLWLEVDRDYNVYAVGKNRELFSWDSNGLLRWRYRVAHTSNEAWPGMLPDASFMVMPTFNGVLQALDGAGNPLWQHLMPALPTVSPQGTTVDFEFSTDFSDITCLMADHEVKWR